MKTVLLDDEFFALTYLEKLCFQIPQIDIVSTFCNPQQALDYIASNPVDLVILDIEMPGLSGIDAAHKLRALRPSIGIIFVTGYGDYALQAFQAEAVSYLMKPCLLKDLQGAISKAARLATTQKRVTIRTFGHFFISIDGMPIRFSNSKARELLALLIDRNGSPVTMGQAVDVLWENRIYDEAVKRLYRKAVGYLNQVLDGTNFFVADRGSCHVIPSMADCDYFTLLENPSSASSLYCGEYLMEYSWAESTNGRLTQLVENLSFK